MTDEELLVALTVESAWATYKDLVEKGEVEESDDPKTMFAYGVMHMMAAVRATIKEMQEAQKTAMKN